MTVLLDNRLTWQDVAKVGQGETLALSDAAIQRIENAARIVESIVERGIRAYGINTGVGALSDTVVDRTAQGKLSRSIILSHACGVGPLLAPREVRAIIAAQIANFAHGYSGVSREIVGHLTTFLERDCIPDVPSRGSAGYLTHNAHTALVLIGEGSAHIAGRALSGREALAELGLQPLVLGAKEGLSLVNGTACATGLSSIALDRAAQLLDWADAIAAMTLEAAGCQMPAFSEAVLSLRVSDGIAKVGKALRARLAGSGLIEAAKGRRTQDALSLRSIPHAHGAARDLFENCAAIVDRELASVTDNPAVAGTPEEPLVWSEAHAVAPGTRSGRRRSCHCHCANCGHERAADRPPGQPIGQRTSPLPRLRPRQPFRLHDRPIHSSGACKREPQAGSARLHRWRPHLGAAGGFPRSSNRCCQQASRRH